MKLVNVGKLKFKLKSKMLNSICDPLFEADN